jgi:chromosome segregation ATPase
MRIQITHLLIALPLLMHAQTEVQNASWAFSTGVAPAFSVTVPMAETKRAEAFFKARLKVISAEVVQKKEVVATGTRLPEVSSDTLRVLVKAERARRAEETTVYLAFKLGGAFIGPDGEQRQVEGCRSWVYRTTVMLKKELAQEALDAGTKRLKDLENAHAMLVREKDRAQGSIEKTSDRIVKDEREKSTVEGERTAMETRVQAKQSEVNTAPTEANAKELQAMLKEQEKLKRKAEGLGRDIEGGRKKVEDLQADIRKNLEEQEAKAREIDAQKKVVQELTTKLAGVN